MNTIGITVLVGHAEGNGVIRPAVLRLAEPILMASTDADLGAVFVKMSELRSSHWVLVPTVSEQPKRRSVFNRNQLLSGSIALGRRLCWSSP